MASVKKRTLQQGRAVYDVRYRDPRGRPRERTFKRIDDARAFAKTIEADVVRGEFLDPAKARRKFDDFAAQWLASTAGLKAKTVVGYESMLRVHVLPRFGGVAVGRIDRLDVREFVAELQAAGAASGTVRAARKVLRLVLNGAVEAGAIKANPCDGVRLGRSEPHEMAFLTMEQLLQLSDAMRLPQYGLLVRFAGVSGLRAGEIGALRVGRVDLLRRRVEVLETVSEVHGHGLVYGPPKTYERRSVPLPPTVADELGALMVNGRPHPDAFVFTAPDGGPLRHRNFMARHFKPAVDASAVPAGMRFHDLRHTCAALLINADPPAHPLAVMKRLGHSSITVTYNTYGHLFPALDEALTDSVDRAYRSARARASRSTATLTPLPHVFPVEGRARDT